LRYSAIALVKGNINRYMMACLMDSTI
jgi:hypothetical protein